MIDIFTASGSAPFAISLAFVAGLFALELASAILGGSILGVGADSPDADIDTDFDFSIETDTDIGVGADGDPSGLNATSSGIFTWIGARDVPFLIWLASFLTMFGLFGLIVQNMANGIFATTLPALIAVALVFMPALAITRIIANWVALIMPKTETTAMRARNLGGHRGTITQGTASRGKPAEAKIKDRHGNFHYLRVEPLHDEDSFAKGSDVTLIRKRGDKFFVI